MACRFWTSGRIFSIGTQKRAQLEYQADFRGAPRRNRAQRRVLHSPLENSPCSWLPKVRVTVRFQTLLGLRRCFLLAGLYRMLPIGMLKRAVCPGCATPRSVCAVCSLSIAIYCSPVFAVVAEKEEAASSKVRVAWLRRAWRERASSCATLLSSILHYYSHHIFCGYRQNQSGVRDRRLRRQVGTCCHIVHVGCNLGCSRVRTRIRARMFMRVSQRPRRCVNRIQEMTRVFLQKPYGIMTLTIRRQRLFPARGPSKGHFQIKQSAR